jgi:hypothetical protein
MQTNRKQFDDKNNYSTSNKVKSMISATPICERIYPVEGEAPGLADLDFLWCLYFLFGPGTLSVVAGVSLDREAGAFGFGGERAGVSEGAGAGTDGVGTGAGVRAGVGATGLGAS